MLNKMDLKLLIEQFGGRGERDVRGGLVAVQSFCSTKRDKKKFQFVFKFALFRCLGTVGSIRLQLEKKIN